MDNAIYGISTEFLWTLAARITPDSQKLDDAGRARFLKIIAGALASRSKSLRLQLRLFLWVVRWLPFLEYRAPFDSLSGEQQDQVLRAFQSSRLALFRKGFWGLKTLLFMGYYGQPELAETIAYRTSKDGNSLLGLRTGKAA